MWIKRVVIDMNGELERTPVRTVVFLIASQFGLFFTSIYGKAILPVDEDMFARVFIWVWLAWTVYVVVPLVRYMSR